jgi:tetratricopeptide (TPR) repeat protein
MSRLSNPQRATGESIRPPLPISGEQNIANPEASLASRRATWLAAAVLSAAALVVYANSFNGALVFDDIPWIVLDPGVHKLWPLSDVLFSANPNFVSGRPVVNLTIAINYALGGTAPGGYHAVNIAIHILAGLTLFGIVRRTLSMPVLRGRFGAAATPLALAVALVWIVHPLQTAAVTYVIQRTESLVGLFYLLTLYCVIRGADSARAVRWYIAAVVACFLGMATKEVMATAPVVVLLYDRTFVSGSFANAFSRRWSLYLALAATWGIVAWTLLSTGFHTGSTGAGAGGFTPVSYAMTQPGVIVHYLKLAFWPSGMSLDYGWPAAESLEAVLLPAIFVALLFGLTIWALVKNSPLGFLGAWFFSILGPTSSFVPIKDAAFDHRMYLPLAAVAALVVIGGYVLWRRFAVGQSADNDLRQWAVPVCLLGGAVIALGCATVARNAIFTSAADVWRDVLEKDPSRARAHNNLAAVLIEEGQYAEGIEHCRTALALTPGYADAENNIGHALALQGKTDEAIPWYERALAHNPDHHFALINLAAALVEKKERQSAIKLYETYLKDYPQDARIEYDLATCFRTEGDLAQAVVHFKKAIALDQENVKARLALAECLHAQGDIAGAVRELEATIHIAPDSATAHNDLANLLVAQGRIADAVDHFERALSLKPDYAAAHHYYAAVLVRQGKNAEAVQHWREAVRLEPKEVQYLSNLSLLLATSADPAARNGAEAVEFAKRAVELAEEKPDANVVAVLAAAYAELGQFENAVTTARQARELAIEQHNNALADQLSDRIKLYESGRPYHEPGR